MKNIDFIIRQISKDLNIPEEEVKIVVMEYWNSVYHKILNMESEVIALKHIGIFTSSRYKIKNYIQKAITKIRKLKLSKDYDDVEKMRILDNKYVKLRQALKRRNLIAIEYANEFGNI